MTPDQVLELVLATVKHSSPKWRRQFLGSLSLSLTISGRGFYYYNQKGVPTELVRFLVESQHQISNILAGGRANSSRVCSAMHGVMNWATDPVTSWEACRAMLDALRWNGVTLPQAASKYVA